jgi:hypothetical protein
MRHWNDDLAVGMYMKTSGMIYSHHEILEITIALLDHDFNLSREIMPFSLTMIPNYPEYHTKKKDIAYALATGMSQSQARGLFLEWYEKLNVKEVFQDYKKLMLVGYGASFMWPFLRSWLGIETYKSIFSPKYRDPYQIATYLNDYYAMRSEVEPFSKLNFSYLCSLAKVNRSKRDTLQDMISGVCLYKAMTKFTITSVGI